MVVGNRAAIMTSGSGIELQASQRLLQRALVLLLEARKAAREWMPRPLGVEPGAVRFWDSGNASEAAGELFCKQEEAVWRHRAGVEVDLAPAEAEAKEDMGGGWRLEAGGLGRN